MSTLATTRNGGLSTGDGKQNQKTGSGWQKLVSENSTPCEVGWVEKAANRNSWNEEGINFANSTPS